MTPVDAGNRPTRVAPPSDDFAPEPPLRTERAMLGSNATATEPLVEREWTLYDVALLLQRARWLVALVALTAISAVALVTLLSPRTYTARASFITTSGRTPPSLGGLAAQFGLQLPPGEAAQSPAFYAELSRSREVGRAVVSRLYPVVRGGDTIRLALIDALDLPGNDDARRQERALRWLDRAMSVSVTDRTGVVHLSVRSREPMLSAETARNVLDELNRFNLERRQSQAAAERDFAERRLREVQGELRDAEERQRSFFARNRDFRGSADLVLQQERLARDVALYTQLYSAVAQSFEESKLEQIRDTPVLTVLDGPEAPIQPDSRGLLLKLLVATIGGLALGVLAVLAREFRVRVRARAPVASSGAGERIRGAAAEPRYTSLP